MNSKIEKKSIFFQKVPIFLSETLTKVLSACKNLSWNHIPRRRGKKNKKSTLKKLLSKAFWSTEFVFLPRLTGMWFHDEFLQALRTFVNVSLKKNWNFLNFFWFFFDFTVHRAQMCSGAERHFRKRRSFCWCPPWSHQCLLFFSRLLVFFCQTKMFW